MESKLFYEYVSTFLWRNVKVRIVLEDDCGSTLRSKRSRLLFARKSQILFLFRSEYRRKTSGKMNFEAFFNLVSVCFQYLSSNLMEYEEKKLDIENIAIW